MNLKLCEETAKKHIKITTPKWSLTEKKELNVGDIKVPLLHWRFCRRLMEMRSLIVNDGAVKNLCSYKTVVIDKSDVDIRELIYRELDTCEWILGDEILYVYSLQNQDNTLLTIAKTTNGVVCTFEIATTLSNESKPVTRHEIVGVEGIITDRSINEQIPVDAVYLYKEDVREPIGYTDMTYELYGLLPDEIEIVDNIKYLFENQDEYDFWNLRNNRLKDLVDCVFQSAKTGEKIFMEVTANEAD